MIVSRHSRPSVPYPTSPLRHFPPSVLSSNSFPLTLLADHHPLNPVVSIFYKNIGGRGYVPSLSTCKSAFCVSDESTGPYNVQTSFDLSPLFSYSCALFSTTENTHLLSFQSLPHSFHRDGGILPPSFPFWNSFPFVDHAHPRSFFSCTYKLQILQLLCFDIHANWWGYGGCGRGILEELL